MPDTKISEFPAAGTLTGSEIFPLVQGGANVRASLADVALVTAGVRSPGEIAAGVFPVRYSADGEIFLPGDVRRYCTAAETNHSQAFIDAQASETVVYAPRGQWNVDHFEMNVDGRRLRTDGLATVIHQRTGNINRRTIEVSASNITIDDITMLGNIATDTGEQQHAIFVRGGTVRNVIIGNVVGIDIRGDVVYIGGVAGQTVSNVRVGRVWGTNILRNIVSLTGCSEIDIVGIDGTGIGYTVLDIEPEPSSLPVKNVTVGYLKGRTASFSSASATNFIDRVFVGNMDLSPSYTGNSTPPYSATLGNNDGLLLRNIKAVSIGNFSAFGFDRYAINVVTNVGELGCETLDIGTVYVNTCSLTENVVNAYFMLAAATSVRIGSVNFAVTGTGKHLFSNVSNIHVSNAIGTLATGCTMFRSCVRQSLETFNVTGGILFGNATSGGINCRNGTHNGERLANNSDHGAFENVTATESVLVFTSGVDHHTLINCTINSEFYQNGVFVTDYTSPYRFGPVYLWVDPAGNKLRIKGSAPANNADGTVVGTQT